MQKKIFALVLLGLMLTTFVPVALARGLDEVLPGYLYPPLEGYYRVRRPNPASNDWGVHGLGTSVVWLGTDLTAQYGDAIYAPFAGVAVSGEEPTATGSRWWVEVTGTGPWEKWVVRYLHLEAEGIVEGEVRATQKIGHQTDHIHTTVLCCQNVERRVGCRNVPILSLISRGSWPGGWYPTDPEFVDGYVPETKELEIPEGAGSPSWDQNWSDTGKPGSGLSLGRSYLPDWGWTGEALRILLWVFVLLLGYVFVAGWWGKVTNRRRMKVLVRFFRLLPTLLWCFENAVLLFLGYCVLLMGGVVVLKPQVWSALVFKVLRIDWWVYLGIAVIGFLAYSLFKRGPYSKLKLIFVTVPWVAVLIATQVFGAVDGIGFDQPWWGGMAPSAPEFPGVELTWWNGNEFVLNPPEKVWQDIWDAGRWGGTDPVYLLCLGSSESTSFWESAACSGVGACGPYQFIGETWLRYQPWATADRFAWPDAAYGAAIMARELALDGYYASLEEHRARFTGADGGLVWNRHTSQADYTFQCVREVEEILGGLP